MDGERSKCIHCNLLSNYFCNLLIARARAEKLIEHVEENYRKHLAAKSMKVTHTRTLPCNATTAHRALRGKKSSVRCFFTCKSVHCRECATAIKWGQETSIYVYHWCSDMFQWVLNRKARSAYFVYLHHLSFFLVSRSESARSAENCTCNIEVSQ